MEFIRIFNRNNPWYPPFKTLYNATFPRDERRDLTTLLSKSRKDEVIMHAIIDNDQFIGLTIISRSSPFYIFDYLAIEPDKRHMGYGSTILKHLLNQYQNQPLLLEIEDPYVIHDQTTVCQKRHAFYLHNGLIDTHMQVNLYHVDYLILTNGYPITFADYVQSYTNAYGMVFTKMLNPIYRGTTTKETYETQR